MELDKRQFIHLDRGKTNRQYLRELGRRVDLRRLLEPTMVAFEEVFSATTDWTADGSRPAGRGMGDFDRLLAEGALKHEPTWLPNA